MKSRVQAVCLLSMIVVLSGVSAGHGFSPQPPEQVAGYTKTILLVEVVSTRKWSTQRTFPNGKKMPDADFFELTVRVKNTLLGSTVKPQTTLKLQRRYGAPVTYDKEGNVLTSWWISVPPFPMFAKKGEQYLVTFKQPFEKVKKDKNGVIHSAAVLKWSQATQKRLLDSIRQWTRMRALHKAINESDVFDKSWRRYDSVSCSYRNPWRLTVPDTGIFGFTISLPRKESDKGSGAWPSAHLEIISPGYRRFSPQPVLKDRPDVKTTKQLMQERPFVGTFFGCPVILVTQDLTAEQNKFIRSKLDALRKTIKETEKNLAIPSTSGSLPWKKVKMTTDGVASLPMWVCS
jgi:hypothetical protein